MQIIVHGSYKRHFDLISIIGDLFRLSGFDVIVPPRQVIDRDDGFVRFAGQATRPLESIELDLLASMRQMVDKGFSYFVNPGGELGASASYELAFAQAIGLPHFFWEPLTSPTAFTTKEAVIRPLELIQTIARRRLLPIPRYQQSSERGYRQYRRVFVQT